MAKKAKNNTLISLALSVLAPFSSGTATATITPTASHHDIKDSIENTIWNFNAPNDGNSAENPFQQNDSIASSDTPSSRILNETQERTNDSIARPDVPSFEYLKTFLAENDSLYQAYVGKMEQQGRFFVSVSNPLDVIYLTNEQISEKGINPAAEVFDLSLARENNVTFSSGFERFQTAYTNTKGSYFGPFQYSDEHMKSMVLWALCQKDKDCQTFARLCIASAMNLSRRDSSAEAKLIASYEQAHDDVVAGKTSIIETLTIDGKPLLKSNDALIKFMDAYAETIQKIDNGENSKTAFNTLFAVKGSVRNNALRAISLQTFTDPILRYAGQKMKFSQIKYVFQKNAGERYFPMTVNLKDLKNVSPTALPALFMARIHGNYSDDLTYALNNHPEGSIDKHSASKDPRAKKRAKTAMTKAQSNIIKEIDGTQYYDYSFYTSCMRITRQKNAPDQAMLEYAANFAVEQKRQSYAVSANTQTLSPELTTTISASSILPPTPALPINITCVNSRRGR